MSPGPSPPPPTPALPQSPLPPADTPRTRSSWQAEPVAQDNGKSLTLLPVTQSGTIQALSLPTAQLPAQEGTKGLCRLEGSICQEPRGGAEGGHLMPGAVVRLAQGQEKSERAVEDEAGVPPVQEQ